MATNNKTHSSSDTREKRAAAFEVRAKLLRDFVFADPHIEPTILKTRRNNIFKHNTVFISVSDGKSRAEVFNGTAPTLEEAWQKATVRTRDYILENNYSAQWIKADIAYGHRIISYEKLKENIRDVRNYFYREGISFDVNFKTALLCDQLNASAFMDFGNRCLNERLLKEYFMQRGITEYEGIPAIVINFHTMLYFMDENKKCYKLFNDSENYGRRAIPRITKDIVYNMTRYAGDFLTANVNEDGSFNYGYMPINNEMVPSYNIVRHTAAIWSLIMTYNTTRDESLIPKIDAAINYVIEHIKYRDSETAYLVEEPDELKLGGCATVIIALSTYADVFKTDKYNALMTAVANAILTFQEADGSYFHVFKAEDFTRKERYRIVYYDGEATFALSRIYGITGDKKYLDAAERSVNFFIDNDYTRYRDHWVAYSVNELTKYIPKEEYFNFGLKNVNVNLRKIYNQDTSYHTYLEMIMAAFDMYQRIKENNYVASYLLEFDHKFFIKTIFRRANHMLNGFLYPEIAMYLKAPETVVNSFCVRHHAFRVRIDDVEHFNGGYYAFYNHYDEIEAYYNEIEPMFAAKSIQLKSEDAEREERSEAVKSMISLFGLEDIDG